MRGPETSCARGRLTRAFRRRSPRRFKDGVRELCAAVERLLDDALAVACNAEDALHVLQSLRHFSAWPQLTARFREKTDDVCAALVDQVSFAARFHADRAYRIPSFAARCPGVCVTAAAQHRRITALKNVSTVTGAFSCDVRVYCFVCFHKKKKKYAKRSGVPV